MTLKSLHFPGLLLALALPVAAQSLDETLARMDRSAAGFRGLTATVKMTSYTALIKESSDESGVMSLYRPKPRDMRMLIEFKQPEARAVAFAGRRFQLYFPKLATVQEYDLGKQGGLIDQFLLLGFGTPGSELKKGYSVKYAAEESLRGVKCDRLELVPLSGEAVKHVRLIEIWVSRTDGVVVQQKVHQPSRDYKLFAYSDMKLNPAMTEESVRLKLPKGVKKETPQR